MLIAFSRRHRPGVLLTPGQPHFSIVIPEFVVIPEGNLRFVLALVFLLSFPKGICVSPGVAPNVRVPHPSRLLRWAGTHTFPAPPFASPFRTLSEAEGGGICCCFNPSPKPGCPFACHSRRQSAFHIGPRRAAPVCEMLWNEYFTGHHLMMPNEINTL